MGKDPPCNLGVTSRDRKWSSPEEEQSDQNEEADAGWTHAVVAALAATVP